MQLEVNLQLSGNITQVLWSCNAKHVDELFQHSYFGLFKNPFCPTAKANSKTKLTALVLLLTSISSL